MSMDICFAGSVVKCICVHIFRLTKYCIEKWLGLRCRSWSIGCPLTLYMSLLPRCILPNNFFSCWVCQLPWKWIPLPLIFLSHTHTLTCTLSLPPLLQLTSHLSTFVFLYHLAVFSPQKQAFTTQNYEEVSSFYVPLYDSVYSPHIIVCWVPCN